MTFCRHLFIPSIILTSLLICHCAPKNNTQKSTSSTQVVNTSGDEPEFQIASFNTFNVATIDKTLPYMTHTNGSPIETPCIERSKKSILWQTENNTIFKYIQTKAPQIKLSILKWIKLELAADTLDSSYQQWEVDIDKIMIRHFNTTDVRFAKEQSCFSLNQTILKTNSKIVTTLFGAKEFTIKSARPIDKASLKKIKQASKKHKIVFRQVNSYPKAKNDQGKRIFKKGKPMFVAPTGELITKKGVPPKNKRPVYEFSLKIPNVLHFAFGDMPSNHWAKEMIPTQCNINLIFDDVIARIPDCSQLNDAGFGVSMGDTPDKIILKAATHSDTASIETDYNTLSFLQISGRIFAWITPTKLEEGAILNIDTIVLHPSSQKEEHLQKLPFGNGPKRKSKRRK